ncbi:MAG: Rieske (2Fe-2S) protein [Pseudomonadota bacterium]
MHVSAVDDIDNPGCVEFRIGGGDWPFKGFVVRRGDQVYAYQNFCVHAGHPLNWSENRFLTPNKDAIICASHGAMFEIDSGLCVAGPCLGKSLRPVAVEVTDGEVFVTGPEGQ